MERPYEGLSPRTYGRALTGIALVLAAIGVLAIYSASTFWGSAKFDDPAHFLKRQLLGAGIGLVVFLLCRRIPYRVWCDRRWLVIGAAVVGLGLVYIIGSKFNGARRWIRFGGIGFQPSEFAKLAVIVWAAAFASRAGESLRSFRHGFLVAMGPILLICALTLFEPDFGTALFIGAVGVMVLVLGGLRISHLVVTGAACLPVLTFFMVTRFDYIRERLQFFGGEEASYQVQQAFIALGSGGLAGRGIGAGTGKLFFLPEVAGDFIFPSIGEEIGFFGVCLVVSLFMAFVWCGHRVALGALARDKFGFLLALGLTAWIGLQAATNLAVVSGTVPTKGIALPFLSYGCSSLVVSLAAVGILASVARDPGVNEAFEEES